MVFSLRPASLMERGSAIVLFFLALCSQRVFGYDNSFDFFPVCAGATCVSPQFEQSICYPIADACACQNQQFLTKSVVCISHHCDAADATITYNAWSKYCRSLGSKLELSKSEWNSLMKNGKSGGDTSPSDTNTSNPTPKQKQNHQSSGTNDDQSDSGSGMSTGDIIGAVTGCIGTAAIILGGLRWFLKRRKRSSTTRSSTTSSSAEPKPPLLDSPDGKVPVSSSSPYYLPPQSGYFPPPTAPQPPAQYPSASPYPPTSPPQQHAHGHPGWY